MSVQKISIYSWRSDAAPELIETLEVPVPAVDNIRYCDVCIVATPGGSYACAECFGVLTQDQFKSHARGHICNTAVNAKYCTICEKDAGVGQLSTDAHFSGKAHRKNHYRQCVELCDLHLTPHTNCGKKVTADQVRESLGLYKKELTLENIASVEETQRAIGAIKKGKHDAGIKPVAWFAGQEGAVCVQAGVEVVRSTPLCDACAGDIGIKPTHVEKGLTVDTTEDQCASCQRREEVFGLPVRSSPRRVYSVAMYLMHQVFGSPTSCQEIRLTLEEFGKLDKADMVGFKMETIDGEVVFVKNVPRKRAKDLFPALVDAEACN